MRLAVGFSIDQDCYQAGRLIGMVKVFGGRMVSAIGMSG